MNISLIQKRLEQLAIDCEPVIIVYRTDGCKADYWRASVDLFRRQEAGNAPLKTFVFRGGTAYLSFANSQTKSRFEAAIEGLGDNWMWDIFRFAKKREDSLLWISDVVGALLDAMPFSEAKATVHPMFTMTEENMRPVPDTTEPIVPPNNDFLDPLGKAILLIKNHPKMSNAAIAHAVGVNSKTLNKPKWKPFRDLRDSMRQHAAPPSGIKSKDGSLDAWDGDDD